MQGLLSSDCPGWCTSGPMPTASTSAWFCSESSASTIQFRSVDQLLRFVLEKNFGDLFGLDSSPNLLAPVLHCRAGGHGEGLCVVMQVSGTTGNDNSTSSMGKNGPVGSHLPGVSVRRSIASLPGSRTSWFWFLYGEISFSTTLIEVLCVTRIKGKSTH